MESNKIELKAPVPRVWRALTDYREFAQWFKVNLDDPFVPGQVSRGHITYPGYEHITWEARIESMEPESLFSFYWPHVRSFEKTDKPADYSPYPCRIPPGTDSGRYTAPTHRVRLQRRSR